MNAETQHPPRGFTLIELIIVIAIIAVLAAVAFPRLIDTQHDARMVKARAIHGAMRSAVALARSRCELDLAADLSALPPANCQATPPQVSMDGKAVDMLNRHPAATANGIDIAANLDLSADGLRIATDSCPSGARCYDIEGGKAPDCRITYHPATLSGTLVSAPEITAATDGC